VIYRWTFVAGLILVFALQGAKAATSPDQLIRQTVDQLINELAEHKTELENDRHRLYEMVDQVIVEHIAVDKVAKLVLARHWREATPEQRASFEEAFRILLIRTYATALFDYTGREEMMFRPLQLNDDDRTTIVRTDVKLPGEPAIPVNYKFLRRENGEWQIFDVTIGGISLVTNYRASYSGIIQARGLDGLIEMLQKKTQETE